MFHRLQHHVGIRLPTDVWLLLSDGKVDEGWEEMLMELLHRCMGFVAYDGSFQSESFALLKERDDAFVGMRLVEAMQKIVLTESGEDLLFQCLVAIFGKGLVDEYLCTVAEELAHFGSAS